MQDSSLSIQDLRHILSNSKKLVKNLFASGGSLSQQTARSGFWVFLSYGSGRILGVIRIIILARVLLPKDFGIVGLAEVAVGFLAVLVEIGVAPALIQKQNITDETLDTAWVISVLRGALLGMMVFLVSGPAATFYQTPELVPVLRLMSLLFIFNGFSNPGIILLQKEMHFRILAYYGLVTGFADLGVTILLASIFRNYWALVYASFFQGLMLLVGSYIIHSFRPKLRWQTGAARDIINYGKFILGGGIVNYFLTMGDNALVGKVLGTTSLGLYRMAYNISNLPSTSISHVIGQVAFPAYAKLQSDLSSLKLAYLKILKMTSLLAVPLAGGMVVLAPELVSVLLGEQWIPMVPAFMVLTFYGLERAVNASVAPLFKAIGKPQIPFYLTLWKLFLLVIIIYPLTLKYGILGTSIASSLVALMISVNVLLPVSRALHCRISALLIPLIGPFTATGWMMSALFAIRLLGWLHTDFFSLIFSILFGVGVYTISLFIVDRKVIAELKDSFLPN
jgi:lipopolysaccharide exporter